jgi:hypothetical protein
MSRKYPFRVGRITFTMGKGGPFQVVITKSAEIDEIVIGDWLHIERLNTRAVWVRLGEQRFTVYIPAKKTDPIIINRQD